MAARSLHVVHLLIRQNLAEGRVGFLVYPHENWRDANGKPYLTLPTKKTVHEPFAEFIEGRPLDDFIQTILHEELGVPAGSYAIEQELEAVELTMESPTTGEETTYRVFPIDLWVAPAERDPLCERVRGEWRTIEEAIAHPALSRTARKVFMDLKDRHTAFTATPPEQPRDKQQAECLRRLFAAVPASASMDALARMWLGENLGGVRLLPRATLDAILAAGSRAFNLRVADPYLPYQMQGLGFTWSFFSEKDPQDLHVHGAPVVEIYGVLEGEFEIWWKPYYERGTSAWCHRVVQAGDWLEVESLRCHIVRWLKPGKGVVFKAGPGPLAEVGKLGVKGKTPCKDCACMKPPQVIALENLKR
jgi:hypothetical protein